MSGSVRLTHAVQSAIHKVVYAARFNQGLPAAVVERTTIPTPVCMHIPVIITGPSVLISVELPILVLVSKAFVTK